MVFLDENRAECVDGTETLWRLSLEKATAKRLNCLLSMPFFCKEQKLHFVLNDSLIFKMI